MTDALGQNTPAFRLPEEASNSVLEKKGKAAAYQRQYRAWIKAGKIKKDQPANLQPTTNVEREGRKRKLAAARQRKCRARKKATVESVLPDSTITVPPIAPAKSTLPITNLSTSAIPTNTHHQRHSGAEKQRAYRKGVKLRCNFCCEDHFDLKEDMENDATGDRAKVKADAVPRKFSGQPKCIRQSKTTLRLVEKKRRYIMQQIPINESKGSQNTNLDDTQSGNNVDQGSLLDSDDSQGEEKADVERADERPPFKTSRNPLKHVRKTEGSPAQQPVNSMKFLSEVVTTRDEYSVFGEHVAYAVRKCNRPKLEVSLAHHYISDILIRLDIGLLAAEIPSIETPHTPSKSMS